MKTFKLKAEMLYEAQVEIEAENYEDAKREARDMAGDGMLLREADIISVVIE